MKFLRLLVAAAAIVMAVSVVGCTKKEAPAEGGDAAAPAGDAAAPAGETK